MTDGKAALSRRGFLTTAAGGAGAAAATGSALGQENETDGNETDGGDGGGGGGGGGEPDLGGYLDDVSNFDGIEDFRGGSPPTVAVGAEGNGGAFAFDPPAIHVDNGATVTWEWTGEGGSHNVVHEDGDFESELVGETGFTFEYTFEEDGIYEYFCDPHKGMGMKGVVVVGTDYPTVGGGDDGSGVQPLPNSALTIGVATTFVMLATLGLAYFFIKYGGDYGGDESA